jgi:hypothetical protein
MRRDDRQVIVIKTTVGNDGADCKVLSRYLPPAVAKRVSFLLRINSLTYISYENLSKDQIPPEWKCSSLCHDC